MGRLHSAFYRVQKIGPDLHHFTPFWQEAGSIVRASQRIFYCVSKLMLQEIWAKSQHLRTCGSRCRTKAVPSHFVADDVHVA